VAALRKFERDCRGRGARFDLIDAVLDVGGRYYLPYRLHATARQFHRGYPEADEFFALKRKYDPQELFQNQFYRQYGGAISP
jgi:FAD/FMN-containing dehydrogenase